MIRKILIAIFLVYTLIWLIIAYTVKNNIVNIVKDAQTDNIKLSYSQVRISGFPLYMRINLVDPKIKFIDHINSKEISAKKMKFLFDFSFQKADMVFGDQIKQQENFADKLIEYDVNSKENIILSVKLNKPLYKLLSKDWLRSIESIQWNNKLLVVNHENKEIFNIIDLAFLIKNEKSQNDSQNSEGDKNLAVQLSLLYDSAEDFLNFKKAKLDLDSLINIASNPTIGENFIKNLTINHLIFSSEDNSQVNLTGSLGFFVRHLPKGKLFFEVTNYHKVVDKLIPNNLLLPKEMIKTLIEKAANSSLSEIVKSDFNEPNFGKIGTYEKIKFDIEFSDKGINIGSINLIEFNSENNDKINDTPEESIDIIN